MSDSSVPSRATLRAKRTRKRRKSVILWIALSVLAVLLFVGLWVGIRGMLAKNALEQAVPAATALPKQIADGDTDAADKSLRMLSTRASDAAALTSDPVWRAVELVPYLGANLSAVRESADILDDVSRDAITPIVKVTQTVGIDAFSPVDGVIPLQPLIDAQPAIAAADVALDSAAHRARAIQTNQTLGVVTEAVKKLQTTVGQASDVVDAVNRAAALLPPMMGAGGERNYVLLFQNPAELRATGGISGALAQITVANGSISLTRQASSADFPKFPSPVLPLPVETRGLYGDITGQFIQDVNLTPQFPLSGELAAEMWRQRFGVQVDGVVSVDPVVLGYLLRATGPITLPTGDVLTSDNAVKLLLSDVYARYPDPPAQDAFFAAAASSVFEAVAGGRFDPAALVDVLAQAGGEHRLLVYSAHDDEQKRLGETTLAGALPVSDAKTARIGVYFNDAAGSKMATYLQTKIGTAVTVCRKDGRPQLGVQVTLTNTAPADAATALPPYVTGDGIVGVTRGNIKLIANIYGVPGSSNLGISSNGAELASHTTTDSGYPVSAVEVELAPGQSTMFTATFLGDAVGVDAIVIQKTPEVNIIPVSEVDISC